MARPISQKLIAFSLPLGPKTSGIPSNDSVWAKSSSATERNVAASTMPWLLPAWRRRFQPSPNTMKETAMEMNSRPVCSGR